MVPAVSDIIRVLDNLAPPELAEDWDNVGLQVGDPSRSVRHIWIALDPTFQVVDSACRRNVDLLITHHPLIFKALKCVNFNSPVGSVINLATRNHLAIFAAHTNLDSAVGGINDILASRIGLNHAEPLAMGKVSQRFKIIIYAPPSAEKMISRRLFQIRSTYKQQESRGAAQRAETGPLVFPVKAINETKKSGSVFREEKIRIETEVAGDEMTAVIDALAEYLAEEKIGYDVFPLVSREAGPGIGRVGYLEPVMDLKSLALMIKKKLRLKFLKMAGDPGLLVKKAAVCTGSGSSLLSNFFESGAQVYISGDLRYHDARDVQAANLGLIDIGHFPSEHLIVDVLADRLKAIFVDSQMDVTVNVCNLERDPFTVL